MQHEAVLRAHLARTLAGLTAPAPSYRGKVRDVFERGEELLLLATDRISAFDVVLGTVPFKGQMLTEQAVFWLEQAQAIIGTHLVERVDAQAMRVRKTRALPVELVVRGYLAGSLMREPKESRGAAYGLAIDPSLKDYEQFEQPIVTPTTKEAVGVHDVPCSLADLIMSGKIEKRHLDRAVAAAVALFKLGQAHAGKQGLILVDTKYEFGLIGDEVVLIDEVHTADSSRFWVRDTYQERLRSGAPPDMLDKERLRRWLLAQGFQGNGPPPTLPADVLVDLAAHYWQLTEKVTGRAFVPAEGDPEPRVRAAVGRFLSLS